MMRYPVVLWTGKGRAGKDTAGRVLCEEMGGVSIALADPIKRFFLKAGLTAEQLWGSEKEVEIVRPDLPGGHCQFWLADAVNHWLTSAQLARIDFWKWEGSLPDRCTPRFLMQTFGTECVQSYSPDLWIDFGLHVADELLIGRKDYTRELGLTPPNELNLTLRGNQFVRPPVVVITDGRFRNEVLKVKARGGWVGLIKRSDGPQEGLAEEAKVHASESEQDSIPLWWFDNVIYNNAGLVDFEKAVARIARYDLTLYD